MVAKILTALNAEVNTAAVTVNTLQISGKQVTLAVFRQLTEEDIVDHKAMTLRGVAWGRVNYLVERKADINVVWQLGDELHRCIVRADAWEPCAPYFTCRAIWNDHHWVRDTPAAGMDCSCVTGFTKYPVAKKPTLWPQLPHDRGNAEAMTQYAAEAAQNEREVQRINEQIEAIKRSHMSACSTRKRQIYLAEKAKADRYAALIKPLFALPQLFIAV